MRVPVLLLLFLLSGIWFSPLLAQNSTLPLGRWQVHVPNNLAKAVAEVDGKLYCATEDGFFLYDKEFGQVKTLSKSDGFSDINISSLAYEPETKTLVVAYENTNIDLMQDGEITNINDIVRKAIPGEKQIFHIYFHQKTAYLACSFGVVVLNLVKQEIKDTYGNLGPAGGVIKVYAGTILNDSMYLATSNGIMAARRSNTNLLDYRSWRTFTPTNGLPPANDQDFRTIATFENKIYAGVNKAGLFRYNGIGWLPVAGDFQNKSFRQLTPNGTYLLIIDSEKLQLLNKNNQETVRDAPLVSNPYAAVPNADAANVFWIADYGKGLIKLTGTTAEQYLPNGPMYNSAFKIYSDNKNVYVLGGGYDGADKPRNSTTGFYELQNGRWQSFNAQTYPDPNQFPPVQDLVGAVRSPVNKKLYLASYGFGLIEWEGPGRFKHYTPDNSPLVSAISGNSGTTRIPGIALDAEGNIWVTNPHPEFPDVPGLHVLRTDGTWQSFNIPGFQEAANLEKILVDAFGQKWITVKKSRKSNGGILVFDDVKNQYRYLSTSAGQGELPGQDVFALTSDKNGYIWVGTDKGIAVFFEPDQVLSNAPVRAEVPIINRRPLLENQAVRAIAVDAANRKWVGTDTGLWLFNEDGDAVVAHFTEANSPLLSNKIIDIGINHGTGEVFIATEAGLISYRGTATETADKPDCAMVFPNPVAPGYSGLVGISGLPNGANVKVTDITGALVYETKANGGTVAWDLRDVNGKRVKSGVYLAYSSTQDGKQSCISKIAVVD